MNYSYSYATDNGTVMAILLGIVSTFLVLFLILGIVYYIFSSLGYYTMAKNKGVDNAWLSWIPIARGYILGRLIDTVVPFGTTMLPNAHIFLIVVPIAASILAFIPFVGWLLVIASTVYYYMALYRLYKLYNADKAVLFLVLSIVFSITIPFFIFALRNREPIEYLER